MNPLIRPWRQLLDFSGRATRTEYLLFHLTALAGMVMLEIVFLAIGAATRVQYRAGQPGVVEAIIGLVFLIACVILLIAHFAIGVRRLHDHGEPGIKYLLSFIPLIGWIFYLMMMFAAGNDYENDYGPDPRQPEGVPQDQLGGVFS